MSYPAILALYKQIGRERAEQAHLDLGLLLTAMEQLGKGAKEAVTTMYAQLNARINDDLEKGRPEKSQRARVASLATRLVAAGARQA